VLQTAKRWFNAYFKQVALVATVAGVAIALLGQRHAIETFSWRLDPWVMAAAVALFALAPLIQGVCFWLVLRSLGVHSRFDEALVIWSRSFLLRYAPSGALALVVRVKSQDRLGASRGDVYTSFGYEQLIALVSGALSCVVAFLSSSTNPPLVATIVLVAALVLAIAVRPGFLGRWLQQRLIARGFEVPTLMRGRAIAGVTALNCLGWLSNGAAAYLMLVALTTGDRPSFAWLVGAYAFAWLLGFIVPLLPGGLGLRDATLAAFLAQPLGAGAGTALSLAMRLANTVGEFAAIGLVEAGYKIASAGRPAGQRLATRVQPAVDRARLVIEELR
jgi:hypothetical protein